MRKRQFNEKEIEKYIKYTDENVLELKEFQGRCVMCGKFLDEVELPIGPERKVTCLKDRDYFVDSYEELLDMEEI